MFLLLRLPVESIGSRARRVGSKENPLWPGIPAGRITQANFLLPSTTQPVRGRIANARALWRLGNLFARRRAEIGRAAWELPYWGGRGRNPEF